MTYYAKDQNGQLVPFNLNGDPALGANQLAMLAALGTPDDPAANGSGEGSIVGFLRFIAASQAVVGAAAAGGATAQHQADQLTLLQQMAASLTAIQATELSEQQVLQALQNSQAVLATHADDVAGNAYLAAMQTLLGGAETHSDATAQTTILAGMQTLLGGLATHPDVVAGDASLAQIVAELQAALPLPTGAATAPLQTAGNASLALILAALGAPLATKPVSSAATNHSGATLAGGVAQPLFPANAARIGWYIQNQSNAPIYVRSVGAAGTNVATLDNNSIQVPAGADFTPPKNSLLAWSVIGLNAAQAFFCEEW